MSSKGNILITGINGFVGSALHLTLKEMGYKVWGFGRSFSKSMDNYYKVDLLDTNALKVVKKKLPKIKFIIHTAAISQSVKFGYKKSVYENNVKITKNIIESFEKEVSHIIFTSSIDVYGDVVRVHPISVNSNLRPNSYYGKSKVKCEEIILNSKIKNCLVLRLCPVFNESNLDDIKKRVFFPFLKSIKMKIRPFPNYSFTHLDTLTKFVKKKVLADVDGKFIYNLSDIKVYSQKEISLWFKGKNILIYVNMLKPFFLVTYLLPKMFGYKIRCLYWKLFMPNIIKNGFVKK